MSRARSHNLPRHVGCAGNPPAPGPGVDGGARQRGVRGDVKGDDVDARQGLSYGTASSGAIRSRPSRRARLRAAKERLEAEVRDAQDAHAARLQARAQLEAQRGRKLRGRKPIAPPAVVDASARANITDPDCRLIRGPRGFVQGYNAQAVCTESQVIIAAELSTDSPDGRLLEPMIRAAREELAAVGIDEPPEVVLAPTVATERPAHRRARHAGQPGDRQSR